MRIHLGVDVGAVSIKTAVLVPAEAVAQVCAATQDSAVALTPLAVPGDAGQVPCVSEPRRTKGQPLEATRQILAELLERLAGVAVGGMAVTGTGGRTVAAALGATTINEFQAAVRGINLLHADVRTIFEIGGETSRFVRVEPDPASGVLGIVDYGNNGDCAAGTGSFLDQQAGRLQVRVEEIAELVEDTARAAQIAGRCSVFAKSDMIHAQQKGYGPAEVLQGLCNAVASNFRSAVARGREPVAPVAVLGGVAANDAVVRGLRESFGLTDGDLFVPTAAASVPAVGVALAAAESATAADNGLREKLEQLSAAAQRADQFGRQRPLSLERVTLLRDQVKPYAFGGRWQPVDAYLGLDIGSVGTKLVLVDDAGEVVHSIFTRTQGRPIEVVTRALREMEEAVGWGVRIKAVGTTGSGRELIGELVGADAITDEITCHKTGAAFVGDRLLGRRPDTIFEIGGQDSKYISWRRRHRRQHSRRGDRPTAGRGRRDRVDRDGLHDERGVCGGDGELPGGAGGGAGGFDQGGVCGSGAAEREADSAGGALHGVHGARRQHGDAARGERDDVIAGLAYSIAYNYINRVVRGRPVGDCIFFPGRDGVQRCGGGGVQHDHGEGDHRAAAQRGAGGDRGGAAGEGEGAGDVGEHAVPRV
jgi:activator of 2-hydroxyglutaryl-CoA dehydratase